MSGNRSNRVEVPEAKAAMDRFKTEVASELG
ncbi:MAG: alpha/beta-type small acid-soluble spore protein, partial [Acetatifactor sp.]|nr:alpha/beta-type small acid-soluble spore protein [Acetatifactor sp.]